MRRLLLLGFLALTVVGAHGRKVEKQAGADAWAAASDMAQARLGLGLQVLPDGRVLAFGGSPDGHLFLSASEIFDPATGSWSAGPGMNHSRYSLGSVLLKDGRVLAVGGYASDASAETYDPAAKKWSAAGELPSPRFEAALVTLASGQVLAVGGTDETDAYFKDALLYDPGANAWTSAGTLVKARAHAQGVRLKDGRVLIAGGNDKSTLHKEALLYDPAAKTWASAGSMITGRYGHTMTLLSDGRVLVAGGFNNGALASCEVYDPDTGWTEAAPMRRSAGQQTAHLRKDGRVLVIGGYNGSTYLDKTALYDPVADRWSDGPTMTQPHADHRSVLLADGGVLVAGGHVGRFLASAERLGPGPAKSGDAAPIETVQHIKRAAPQPAPAPAPAPAPPALVKTGPTHPEDFALIVGVEKYRSLPEAKFGENDASAFREYAEKRLGVPEENIIYLHGQTATKTDLTKYVEEWLPRNVSKDSRVYFYYSGHGAPDPSKGTAYLVPWDGDASFLESSAYAVSRLYEQLDKLAAREVVVLLDACFSGAGARSVIADGLRPLVLKTEAAVPKSGKLTILTAAGSDEAAGSLDPQRHGLFTYYLLQGLSGEADGDRDGHVGVGELHDFVHKNVLRAAHRQNREQNPGLKTGSARLRLY